MNHQRLRLAVTGQSGQVVSALAAQTSDNFEIIPLGRPQLDLTNRTSVIDTLRRAHCDAIINAAAYTAVDKAESEPEVAMRVNADGAGHVADAATELRVPLLHISTDYVFDGTLDRPYHEADATNPTGAYGRSKLEGEVRVAAGCANHVILRTAWVYSAYGTNFVKTMLRLGESRNELGVVADQIGNPTSASDIADSLLTIAARMTSDTDPALRGVFHLTSAGEASWADFAEAIFQTAEQHGRHAVRINRITTADYPTPARRPANSRLDNSKLQQIYGLALPHWRQSVSDCVNHLLHQ